MNEWMKDGSIHICHPELVIVRVFSAGFLLITHYSWQALRKSVSLTFGRGMWQRRGQSRFCFLPRQQQIAGKQCPRDAVIKAEMAQFPTKIKRHPEVCPLGLWLFNVHITPDIREILGCFCQLTRGRFNKVISWFSFTLVYNISLLL